MDEIIPLCECGGYVKPDIVFFGESLPPRFVNFSRQDCGKADLLIVMGTSLKVYPFAGLINQVPRFCPRLLINRELVGTSYFPFSLGFKVNQPGNDRDLAMLGDVQEQVRKLVHLLGWEKELNDLIASGPVPLATSSQ